VPSRASPRRAREFPFALIVLALLPVASCGRAPTRVVPTDTFTVALPPVLPNVPPSRFNVPIKYELASLLAVIERVVPQQFGSMDSIRQVGDDSRRRYAFEAVRDPFTVYADGPVVRLRAGLSYKVRGYYKPIIGPTMSAGCGGGEAPPRIAIELVTPLALDRNWHLSSQVELVRVEPASATEEDRCKVSVLRRDITDQVVAAARQALTDKIPEIDERIAAIDLTSRFTEWWGLLNRPIRVADGAWLVLGPERLRLGKVDGKGNVLTVRVGLDARPRVVTGATPPAVARTPLPPLARDTVSNGFRIALEGIIDYATASRAMTTALRGKIVAEGGRSVVVESVTVSPAMDNRLALAVHFSGDARGTLRFLGVPRYDPQVGEVTMPDLDYDLTTNNQLINTYAWLRSDVLRARFRERAHVPQTPVIDRARSLLLLGLNRKLGAGMTVSATVDSVTVRGLYVTRSALVAHAEARGRAAVSVRQE
jgi:hypothetical protein